MGGIIIFSWIQVASVAFWPVLPSYARIMKLQNFWKVALPILQVHL